MSQEVLSIMFCFMQGTFAPPSTNTDCMRLWQCDYSQYAANAGYGRRKYSSVLDAPK